MRAFLWMCARCEHSRHQACREENTAEPSKQVGFHLGALNTLWNQKAQDQQTKTEGVWPVLPLSRSPGEEVQASSAGGGGAGQQLRLQEGWSEPHLHCGTLLKACLGVNCVPLSNECF